MRTPAGSYFFRGRIVAYLKPALTIAEQLAHLHARGMVFDDEQQTAHDLTHKNYYRLRAYWMPFEVTDDERGRTFREGTTWSQVMELYELDQELRALLMLAIERLEISLRTCWAHVLSLQYGPHAHEDAGIFKNSGTHDWLWKRLKKDFEESREVFAIHHRTRYSELKTPPIWATCELMTLGQLSHWYSNLKLRKDRQEIARGYGVDEKILTSFLHHLTVVRNSCAHHGRIWNRNVVVRMTVPSLGVRRTDCFNTMNLDKIYNTLVMLWLLLEIIDPSFKWKEAIKSLLAAYPNANPAAMGFPADWMEKWH